MLSPGQPLYIMLFAGGIIFFSFFYTAIMMDPKEIADNLKRQGAYVPGIRPGQQTAAYLDDVITRLTLFGAMYVTGVCLLPEFMVVFFNVTMQLGGYGAVDRCGGVHGLHVAGAATPDVQPVRRS